VIVLLITLGALAFGASVGLIERWQQQNERERSTRLWEERSPTGNCRSGGKEGS
jgi:hypothetical protein